MTRHPRVYRSRQFVSCRLPDEIRDQIDEIIAQRNQEDYARRTTVQSLVAEWIKAGLEREPPTAKPPDSK